MPPTDRQEWTSGVGQGGDETEEVSASAVRVGVERDALRPEDDRRRVEEIDALAREAGVVTDVDYERRRCLGTF
jgi:hypothetical protein